MDVGCGTGDLACDLAELGLDTIGIDFSAEMIELCRELARERGVSGVSFTCASVFDHEFADASLDLVSANGFIEYISPEELDAFWALCHRILKPGGRVVVSSRNRLFNAFSVNGYTLQEIEAGAAEALLREAVATTVGRTVHEMSDLEPAPPQPPSMRHPDTGIDVATRYQFTPLQLGRMFEQHGFRCADVLPVHVHGVLPEFKARHPAVHVEIATLLHTFAGRSPSLLPHASAFMIHGVKR